MLGMGSGVELSVGRCKKEEKMNIEKYPVTVDYRKTIEEMIEAGRYDWKNPDINAKNFPVSGEDTLEANLELVHLNMVAGTKEVETYLEANGLRAATLEELLAFGATYPNIQREFPIVAIGSSWVYPDGDRLVPGLSGDGSERDLFLNWNDGDWLDVCRFLAVRK